MKRMHNIISLFLCVVVLLSSMPMSVVATTETMKNIFAGGDGTEENPYQVSTPEQLDTVRMNLSAHYILINDIDMSHWGSWTPIGCAYPVYGTAGYTKVDKSGEKYFTGTFDGGNHRIYNLIISDTAVSPESDCFGLFAAVDNCVIKNLSLYNVEYLIDKEKTDYSTLCSNTNILYSVCVGGIVGRMKDNKSSHIENCYVSGKIILINCNNAYVGGICGFGYGNFVNCKNKTNITVIGDSDCRYTLDSSVYCGGIAGDVSRSNVENCTNYGDLNATAGSMVFLGGIAGKSYSPISNCNNHGDLRGYSLGCTKLIPGSSGDTNVGGIAAVCGDEITHCKNYGNLYGFANTQNNASRWSDYSSYVGGIAGFVSGYGGNIISCYNLCSSVDSFSFSGDSNQISSGNAGRIAGFNINISDCYSISTTTINDRIPTENIGPNLLNGATLSNDESDDIISDQEGMENEPQISVKYGADKFSFGSDITGYVGDEIDTLVVYISSNENIASLDIISSDTEVVEISTIEIGVGDYVASENEHIATIPLKLKAEGSSTITITSPEGVSESVTVSVVKKVFVVPEDGGFSPQKNGWSFVNGEEGFGYDEYKGSYFIPAERYATVFGEEYVAAATVEQGTFNSMIPTTWGGNCYGMSVTSVLFYLGMLEWSDYDDLYENDFTNVNSYYNTLRYHSELAGLLQWGYASSDVNTSITNLIECYQVLQYGCKSGYKAEEGSTFAEMEENFMVFQGKIGVDEQKDVYEHNPRGNYISAVYDKIINTTEPLLVDMHGRLGGHAMVIRTDIAPVESGDRWYKIYVYDPNHPYMSNDEVLSQYTLKSYYLNLDSDDTYIEINPSENKWRYCGATNASESSSYWGCDADGNIMTSNWMPEYMFVYSLSDIEYPTKFDGTERWKCRYLENNEECCSLSITDKSNFILYLPNGDEVVKVIDGEPIIYQSNVKFQPYVGYVEGEEKKCGGKLIIPYKEFDIEYVGGDDISVIDEDSVINVACNGKAMLDFSMEDNTVHIGSATKNEVIIQITDVASESGYTSVYVEGNLSANDSLLFSLKGNKLLLDEEIEGESKLNVYTDNDSHQNELYITTLSSKSADVEIENIREMMYVKKISGSIINYGDSTDTIIRLLKDSTVVQEVVGTTTYELTDVISGTYTLEVSKANHVTRTYEIIVADSDVVQDVKLHLLGDVTGDGNVNTIDVNRVYAHVRGTNLLTGYELQCANVAGSGETVNTIDVNRIYAHIKETNLLW